MTPEEVTKIRELLTHEDAEIQKQGLELARSFKNNSEVFNDFISDAQVEFTVKLKQNINRVETVTLRLASWSFEQTFTSRGTWKDTGLNQPDLPPETVFNLDVQVNMNGVTLLLSPDDERPDIDSLIGALTTIALSKIGSEDIDTWWPNVGAEDGHTEVLSAFFDPELSEDLEVDLYDVAISGDHDEVEQKFEKGSIREIEVSFADGEVMTLR